MNLLELAYKEHSKWLNIAKKLGAADYSEDVVQEMYIRLTKYQKHPSKIVNNDQVNSFFVYVIIRNIIYDLAKVKSVVCYIDHEEFEKLYIEQEERDSQIDEWDEVVQQEIQEWHWYDRMLFNLVYENGEKLRQISRGSGISLSSIFNTMKNAKKRIKTAIEEKG